MKIRTSFVSNSSSSSFIIFFDNEEKEKLNRRHLSKKFNINPNKKYYNRWQGFICSGEQILSELFNDIDSFILKNKEEAIDTLREEIVSTLWNFDNSYNDEFREQDFQESILNIVKLFKKYVVDKDKFMAEVQKFKDIRTAYNLAEQRKQSTYISKTTLRYDFMQKQLELFADKIIEMIDFDKYFYVVLTYSDDYPVGSQLEGGKHLIKSNTLRISHH